MLLKECWTFVSWAHSSVGTQSCPTPTGRSGRLSDLTRPRYVRVLDSTGERQLKHDKLVVNQTLSSSSGFVEFPLFVLATRSLDQVFAACLKAGGAVGFQSYRNVGTLFCQVSHRPAVRPALRRLDLTVVCLGFAYV